MKNMRQTFCLLLLTFLFGAMQTVTAFAADESSVWADLNGTSDGTEVQIATDTTVTDGVVELVYDDSDLTYQGVEVSDAYVAMYSVNADEAGVVRISWVAPEEYAADADELPLIQVNFTGQTTEDKVSLSGVVYNSSGVEVPVEAEARVEEPENPTVPETEESKPEESKPEEIKPAETEPAEDEDPETPGGNETDAAKPGENQPGSGEPGTGDNANPILFIVIGVCAVAACAAMIVIKRRTAK